MMLRRTVSCPQVGHEPRGPGGVGGDEHGIPRPGVVIPIEGT